MNNYLRKTIRKHATQSKLLDLIGHAEMEKEIQKNGIGYYSGSRVDCTNKEIEFELDENELKRYLDVVKEVKMKGTDGSV